MKAMKSALLVALVSTLALWLALLWLFNSRILWFLDERQQSQKHLSSYTPYSCFNFARCF